MRTKHHLLWMGKDWKQKTYSKRLREALSFPIDANDHIKLHEQCQPVPVLPEKVCKKLLTEYREKRDKNAYNAALWLISEVDDEDFITALTAQFPFLGG